jgi:hypothetical protein
VPSLRKFAFHLRHRARDAAFRNNQPVSINLRYNSYTREARAAWSPRVKATEQDRAAAAEFHRKGFRVLPPPANFDGNAIRTKVDTLFSHESNRFFIMDGMYRLIDGIERIPEIMDVFDAEMEGLLESYYRSHFKIFGAYFYRTLPTPSRPRSSFLWHLDNCPGPEVKLMVYLDDVVEDTGAFRLKDLDLTDKIRAKGFRDRNQIVAVQSELEDKDTTVVVDGPPGLRCLFQNGGVIHKATYPEREHRDIVTFVIIPSDTHWRTHFARNRHLLSTNAGACVDPRTDKPEHVGYQY